MMRMLIWVLVLAAMAVGLALAARYNDGYVLLVLPPWRAELSLNFLLIVLAVFLLAGHWLLSFVKHVLNLPEAVLNFRHRRTVLRSAELLQDAYRLLSEGRYGHALRKLENSYEGHPQSAMVALLGWRAAHALRDEHKIALWHNRAIAAGVEFESARLITEAELALTDRSYDAAHAALQKQVDRGRRHIAALRLQLRAEQGLGNWREVARVARQLEKYRGMTAEQTAPVRQRALRQVLLELQSDAPALRKFWNEMDAAERTAPALAQLAAKTLIAAGADDEAQRIIESALECNWDSELVLEYAQCHKGDLKLRLARAEKWLVQHPRDAALLMVLGRLCVEQQLWGKARSFIEASLSVAETRAAHVELARLLDRLEKSALAERHYRAAALL